MLNERWVRRLLNQIEPDGSFLQDIGTLLKRKMFFLRELGPQFRQDPRLSHHTGRGETDALEFFHASGEV